MTGEGVRRAAAALAGIAVRAPLIDAPFLTARVGHPVRLKAEMRQPMGAFKLRGAYTADSRLAPPHPPPPHHTPPPPPPNNQKNKKKNAHKPPHPTPKKKKKKYIFLYKILNF
jgi:hypothetical protein